MYPGIDDNEKMNILTENMIIKYFSMLSQSGPLLHSPRTADEFPDDRMQLQFWNTCQNKQTNKNKKPVS